MSAPPATFSFKSLPWGKIAIVAVILLGIGLLSRQIDVDEVHAYTKRFDSWIVFVAITLLPLVGFPVTVLHVLAGMRWGPKLGYTLVVLSIVLQLFASYALVHLFRPVFERRLAKFRERIPKGAHGPVTLFTALLPGVPFFAKNYLIPVMGVPLWTFIMWCFPLHALRASLAVLFGHQSNELTPTRIAWFCAYFVLITLSCAWVFRRLRAEVGDPSLAASGQTPRA